ncbi:MAG: sugar phosphate nucleotidyltransferase [Planctomycetota bacterium]
MVRRAIILAGGRGRRLLPYTSVLPKPLMPVGEQPILEIVVGQLRKAGFDRITMAVGHLASLIQAYFGAGEKFGVQIDYSIEREPLGTAGPLSLLADLDEDVLVMNGDVLTDLDYDVLMRDHRASGAMATLAVYRKRMDVSLGVLEVGEDRRVNAYIEKPVHHFEVSTGIYCFRPDVLRHLTPGAPCDLPVLVTRLIETGEIVRAFRIEGAWLDIGRPEDYETAQEMWVNGAFS